MENSLIRTQLENIGGCYGTHDTHSNEDATASAVSSPIECHSSLELHETNFMRAMIRFGKNHQKKTMFSEKIAKFNHYLGQKY